MRGNSLGWLDIDFLVSCSFRMVFQAAVMLFRKHCVSCCGSSRVGDGKDIPLTARMSFKSCRLGLHLASLAQPHDDAWMSTIANHSLQIAWPSNYSSFFGVRPWRLETGGDVHLGDVAIMRRIVELCSRPWFEPRRPRGCWKPQSVKGWHDTTVGEVGAEEHGLATTTNAL